jgi:hypothetical protein
MLFSKGVVMLYGRAISGTSEVIFTLMMSLGWMYISDHLKLPEAGMFFKYNKSFLLAQDVTLKKSTVPTSRDKYVLIFTVVFV